MKPGVGSAYLLFDLTQGATRDDIRERWQGGDYGEKHERPRGDIVAGWLQLAGQ